MSWAHIVVGGGIAGVSCAQELATRLPEARILLLSASSVLKGITNVVRITDNLDSFDVEERPLTFLARAHPNVSVVQAAVASIDDERHLVITEAGEAHAYRHSVCVCSGAAPRWIASHPRVIGVRDTESVDQLCQRLASARRLCVVGNGAIAMEFVHAAKGMHVVWVGRDEFAGAAMIDASAAAFLTGSMGVAEAAATSLAAAATAAAVGTAGSAGAGPAAGSPTMLPARLPESASRGEHRARSRVLGNALGPRWIAEVEHAVAERARLDGRSVPTQLGGRQAPVTAATGLELQYPAEQQRRRRRRRRDADGTADGRDSDDEQVATLAGPVSHERSTDAGARLEMETEVAELLELVEDSSGACWRRVPLDEQPQLSPSDPRSLASAGVAAGAWGDQAESESTPASRPWPLRVVLRNGRVYDVDLVISATGVRPACPFLPARFPRAADGGVSVTATMQTLGSPSVFAAGDVCTVSEATSPHWHQMRLWSQARTQGRLAAMHMSGQADELGGGLALELFAHATSFFGHKVVALGRYNAQGLSREWQVVTQHRVVTADGVRDATDAERVLAQGAGCRDSGVGSRPAASDAADGEVPARPQLQLLVRVTPGHEYVKVVLLQGRVIGALLVGDTDLEETMENLILNELDVSDQAERLLDPDLDIEDYFD